MVLLEVPRGWIKVLWYFVTMFFGSFSKGVLLPPESPHFSPRALLHAKLDALLDECDLVADNAA